MNFLRSLFNRFCSNKELRVIVAVSFVAFSFKLYLLTKRTLYIDPDEGYYLILARNLLEGKGYTFNGLPNIIFPPFLPLAIALFYSIFRHLQLALNIITALSGTLLGVITYLIARKKLSLFSSFACWFLVLFVYQLNSFLPISARYTNILYRGSDILNTFLVLTSFYLILLLIETDKYRFSILAGIVFSLAYLTRPEGFLLFLGLFMFFLVSKFFSFISLSFKRLVCFALVFLIFSFPYILYLKKTTGKWMISGKISASQKYRESLLDVIKNENWSPFTKIHYSLNRESSEMNDLYFGFHPQSDQGENVSLGAILDRAKANLKLYGTIPKTLFPLPLWPFFGLGFFAAVANIIKRKSRLDLVLLILIPYSLGIETLSYPIPRHHLFLIPVFILYATQGLFFFTSKLSPQNEVLQKKVFLLIFSIFLIFIVYDYVMNSTKNLLNTPMFRISRSVELEISQRLKQAGAEIIMSSHPSFAVRAFSDWQVLPIAPLSTLLQFGRRKNVDYLVLPEEKAFFYHILSLEDSYIPKNPEDSLDFKILEKGNSFDLIKVVKKE